MCYLIWFRQHLLQRYYLKASYSIFWFVLHQPKQQLYRWLMCGVCEVPSGPSWEDRGRWTITSVFKWHGRGGKSKFKENIQKLCLDGTHRPIICHTTKEKIIKTNRGTRNPNKTSSVHWGELVIFPIATWLDMLLLNNLLHICQVGKFKI